ncbi:MAG: AmmeMemoRadiSam system protein A [Candidatus Paceibacterota bacterium]|jgi:AmmeMemoRadiSam system protein A
MHILVELAKKTVEEHIKSGTVLTVPLDFPSEFISRKAGVFVTIEEKGDLRGCIGTYLPCHENVAVETIQNAVAAASQDYRFDPIDISELPYLKYTVSILNRPDPVRNLEELDPKIYGVIVKSSKGNGEKTGLLLPGLEGIDRADDQLAIACQKAGIDSEKEQIKIYKFTVEKYS